MTLSIIIPAYNESQRIGKTLLKLKAYLASHSIPAEIIVVDDGSSDDAVRVVNTLNIPALRIVSNSTNRGKGYSVRHGFRVANGESVLFMDADGSTSLDEIDKFLNLMRDGYDVLIGSRYSYGSNITIRQPIFRRFVGIVSRNLIRFLFNFPYSDTQCGFKMFSRSAVNELLPYMHENGFIFDVEILYWARRLKMKALEVGVTWENDEESKITFLKGPVHMMWKLLSFRLRILIYPG